MYTGSILDGMRAASGMTLAARYVFAPLLVQHPLAKSIRPIRKRSQAKLPAADNPIGYRPPTPSIPHGPSPVTIFSSFVAKPSNRG